MDPFCCYFALKICVVSCAALSLLTQRGVGSGEGGVWIGRIDRGTISEESNKMVFLERLHREEGLSGICD